MIVYGDNIMDIRGWITVGDVVKNRFHSLAGIVQPFQTFRNINDYKLPDSHHLDINANLSIKYRLGETVVGLGVYNIYNHYMSAACTWAIMGKKPY